MRRRTTQDQKGRQSLVEGAWPIVPPKLQRLAGVVRIVFERLHVRVTAPLLHVLSVPRDAHLALRTENRQVGEETR